MDDEEKQAMVDKFAEKFRQDFERAMEDSLTYGYGFISITADGAMAYVPVDFVVSWAKSIEEYTVEIEN